MPYKSISFLILCSAFCIASIAQQASFSDAAQNYNRLLIEKSNGSFTRVSNFKVIGSPYLLGEKHNSNLFAKGETAYNLLLSYNIFTQDIEFYSPQNPDKQLTKEPGLVDSFVIKADKVSSINDSLRFVYGALIGATEKAYFQKIVDSPVYKLFKKYKCELGIVSTNYIQSDLRQFDISYDYYYKKAGTEGIKKLKLNRNAIIKEFKDVKELSGIITDSDFAINPEEFIKKAFDELNNKQ